MDEARQQERTWLDSNGLEWLFRWGEHVRVWNTEEEAYHKKEAILLSEVEGASRNPFLVLCVGDCEPTYWRFCEPAGTIQGTSQTSLSREQRPRRRLFVGPFPGDISHPDGSNVSDEERLAAIVWLCQESGFKRGGVWGCLDTNRRLLECLIKELPEFVTSATWIKYDFASIDIFLSALAKIVRPVNYPAKSERHFPRPWPNWPSHGDKRYCNDCRDNLVARAFGW